VDGSLWRRAQGKLCLGDKYLQNIGARVDRDQPCADMVQRL